MDITDVKFALLPHSRVRLSFTMPAAVVQRHYRAAVAHYVQTVEIKGFRKGKVPEHIILSRFADELRARAQQETVQTAVEQALESKTEYQLLSYDPPRLVGTPAYDPEKKFVAAVEFDILPAVRLPAYQQIPVTIPALTVDAADIQRELDQLQQQRALFYPREATEAVRDGDAVALDIRDTGGAQQNDVRFIIGSQDAPDYARALIGMKAGEEKAVTSGSGATETPMTITLKSAQRRELPALDDAFAAQINTSLSTLADLKQAIRNELESHYQRRLEQIKRERIVQHITAQVSIEVPRSMIETEKEHMWHHLLRRYRMTAEQLVQTLEQSGKSKAALFQDWDGDVTQRLTESLVIRELKRQEQIAVDGQRLDAFIAARAATSGHDPETLKKMYTENKKMGDVIQECAEALLFERLFAKATFTVDKKLKLD